MPLGSLGSLSGPNSVLPKAVRTPATLQRSPTVAPTGVPRQVRQGDYIVTYAPSGAVLSRVYSPVSSPRANSITAGLNAGRASSTNTVANAISKAKSNPVSSNPVSNIIKQAQSNSTNYGGGGALGAGGQMAQNSFDVYGASGNTGGGAATGGSTTGYEDAGSGVTYTGPFAGINDKQADYMVANPLAIAAKVFGLDMANNPTLAGLLSPVLEAAQNPYISAVLNPGMTGVPDQNNELNFAANLLKQYTTPGGSFLSPTAGLQGIATAMGDPNSALNAVLSTATGEGAAGAAAQFDLFQKIMAPFLSMGTGAWGSDIFDALGYDAYNKYTLGQAATPGLPKQDFLTSLMAQMGYPGRTLK